MSAMTLAPAYRRPRLQSRSPMPPSSSSWASVFSGPPRPACGHKPVVHPTRGQDSSIKLSLRDKHFSSSKSNRPYHTGFGSGLARVRPDCQPSLTAFPRNGSRDGRVAETSFGSHSSPAPAPPPSDTCRQRAVRASCTIPARPRRSPASRRARA